MRSSLTASPLTRQHVGDDAFCCAIVSVPPDPVLANRTRVFRLPGGTIAFQTHATAGPAPKELAVTGGAGTFHNAGGEGTLVGFGPVQGKLTLRLLNLVSRTGKADAAAGAS